MVQVFTWPIIGRCKRTLRSPILESEGVVAPLSLEARKPWFFAMLEASEEGGKGFVQAAQHILQHLAVDVLIGGIGRFDFCQFCRLSGVAQALAAHLVEGAALL